jgi:EF hand
MTMIRAIHVLLIPITAAGALCGLVGCGPSLRGPSYYPSAMAREAIRLYDTNNDGKLDTNELKHCPALADALAVLDTNNDKCIDEAELTAAMQTFVTQNAGVNVMDIRVSKDGKPVVGATVKLIPEPFMLGSVEAASGVTNADGMVRPQIEGLRIPGVRLGFYRAEVTREGETIPAKFNTKTTLGKMIGYRWHGAWHIRLD